MPPFQYLCQEKKRKRVFTTSFQYITGIYKMSGAHISIARFEPTNLARTSTRLKYGK